MAATVQLVCVRNVTHGTVLGRAAELARSPVRRFLGLMGRVGWTDTDGLLIRPCNAVHTFFMRMPIDVVFVGAGDVVVDVAPTQRPWRVGPIVWQVGAGNPGRHDRRERNEDGRLLARRGFPALAGW